MFELDRHIEILLLKHSCVIVPGFGGFMAHHVSARFDETDGTIIPPMRTVGFNPQLTLNDSLLVQSYIEAYDVSYPEALRMIESEVAELRSCLERDRYFDVSTVGRLYLNDYGQYEFEPCEAGILTPSFYGLPSVEIARETCNAPVDVVPSESAETETAQEEPQTIVTYLEEEESPVFVEEDMDSPAAESGNVVSLPWGKLVAACLLLMIAFATPFALKSNIVHDLSISGFNPEFFSRFIPSELKSLESEKPTHNVESTIAVTPKQTENKAVAQVTETAKPETESVVSNDVVPETKPVVIEQPQQTTEEVADKNADKKAVVAETVEKKPSKEESTNKAEKPETKKADIKKAEHEKTDSHKVDSHKADSHKAEIKAQKKAEESTKPAAAKKNPVYTIVLSSSTNIANANNYVNNLHNRGYIAARTYVNGNQVRVVHGRYASYIDACQMRDNLQALPEFDQCWVLEIQQ